MTILKWLIGIVAVAYLGGLALLYVKQRSMLFPIPPVGRTAPAAAGFPEAEEQVLATADNERVIVWHVGTPMVQVGWHCLKDHSLLHGRDNLIQAPPVI